MLAQRDTAAELGAHRLHAVADPEDRHAEPEDELGCPRCLGSGQRGRAARQDDRVGSKVAESVVADRVGVDLAIDPALAHPARDQLGNLAAEIEDQDSVWTWLALEYSDKKPVGAVARRGQPEISLAARRDAADRLVPRHARQAPRKIGRGREKGIGLRLVLLVQHRAGRIDEPPARANQARSAVENLLLPDDEVGKHLQG